jgi:PAS domain S-box-containing protein
MRSLLTEDVNPAEKAGYGTWLRYLLRVLAIFLLYFAFGRLGLSIPFTVNNISPIWPASGLALGAVVVWGYGLWPGILLAAFLVNFLSPLPMESAAFMAIGNTTSALFGGYLLKRVVRFEPPLVRLKDVIGLVTLGALISPILAASIGTSALYFAHIQPWNHFLSAWRVWWCGDAMGVLIAAPFFFLPGRELILPFWRSRRFEFLLLLTSLSALCLTIFTTLAAQGVRDDVLAFLLFPFVLWAAIRFRIAGAAMASVVITGIAAWGTAHGHGPFVAHPPLYDIIVLQLFISVTSVTGLMLAALLSERENISEAFQTNQKLLHELEKTQKSLTENQTRLTLAQRAARMGVWEWDISANEVIWSMGAPALYGVTQQSVQIVYEDWLNYIHPEDREAVKTSIKSALDGTREHDLEFRTISSDGKTRWLAGRGKVFHDVYGKPIRMTGICVDISELKQAQDALRHAHDQLELRVQARTNELAASNRALTAEIKDRTQAQELLEFQTRRLREQSRLLDLANDAIVIRTFDGAVSYWNEGAERLYGWKKQEAVTKQMDELLKTDFPKTMEEIKQALLDAGSWEGELVETRRDGTQITVASNWTLWRDEDGTPRGWLQINSNVSQRKDAEYALRELSGRLLHLQDDERRRLARELHDSTGQNLAALQMTLTVIEQRAKGWDEETLRLLEDVTAMASQVVQEIRTLSYLLHPPLLDEAGLTSALSWYVDGLTQRSNLKIDLEIPSDLGRLSPDQEIAIFRVVQECLTNIHRHSGSSTAKIQLKRNVSELCLTVSDTGSGIPEQDSSEPGARKTMGVGIRGMRERMRDLGGEMQIRQGNPGTIVEASFPLNKPVNSTQAQELSRVQAEA